VKRVVSGHVHRATQVQWGHAVLSSAPSTAYQCGIGAGDFLTPDPMLSDLPSAAPLFWWRDGDLLATDAELPLPHTRVDLRDLITDFEPYELAAKAGGPIPKDH
jgi:hypothetical protein